MKYLIAINLVDPLVIAMQRFQYRLYIRCRDHLCQDRIPILQMRRLFCWNGLLCDCYSAGMGLCETAILLEWVYVRLLFCQNGFMCNCHSVGMGYCGRCKEPKCPVYSHSAITEMRNELKKSVSYTDFNPRLPSDVCSRSHCRYSKKYDRDSDPKPKAKTG